MKVNGHRLNNCEKKSSLRVKNWAPSKSRLTWTKMTMNVKRRNNSCWARQRKPLHRRSRSQPRPPAHQRFINCISHRWNMHNTWAHKTTLTQVVQKMTLALTMSKSTSRKETNQIMTGIKSSLVPSLLTPLLRRFVDFCVFCSLFPRTVCLDTQLFIRLALFSSSTIFSRKQQKCMYRPNSPSSSLTVELVNSSRSSKAQIVRF